LTQSEDGRANAGEALGDPTPIVLVAEDIEGLAE
jgi:hypothetical protein